MRVPSNAVKRVAVQRSPGNPLVTFASSSSLAENINGPSVIRTPEWIQNPLGRYYMYFAHHKGKYVRLAYADDLDGPWTVHEPGTLQLEQAASFKGHVASPDVHIDRDRELIRMYFHGPVHNQKGQKTGVAVSRDGLSFEASNAILGDPYFRAWEHDSAWYAIAKNYKMSKKDRSCGMLYRSNDGLGGFRLCRKSFVVGMRHAAVKRHGGTLLVFYTRLYDAPERILVSSVNIEKHWRRWQPSDPIDVLAPEEDYEGAAYDIEPSRSSAASGVRQLRDPCFFEEDGRSYLFYSIAGESGIAMARIEIEW